MTPAFRLGFSRPFKILTKTHGRAPQPINGARQQEVQRQFATFLIQTRCQIVCVCGGFDVRDSSLSSSLEVGTRPLDHGGVRGAAEIFNLSATHMMSKEGGGGGGGNI